MDPRILQRIEELKDRLSTLRSREPDTASLIGIEAIEQEIARTAAQLPREWDVVQPEEPAEALIGDAPIDLRW